jgi:arylsulfatase A
MKYWEKINKFNPTMLKTYLTLLPLLFTVGSCKGPARENRFQAAPSGRPNVVLIVVDDLGWTDLGCYGSDYYETPNVDRLASEGLSFTHAYSAAALCSPSRASIITGRYPVRSGITNWIPARHQQGQKLEEKETNAGTFEINPGRPMLTPVNAGFLPGREVTIAEILESEGYATCHIGKWHLGGGEHDPLSQGYQVNRGGCDLGEPPSYFDPYYRGAGEIWEGEPAIEGIPSLPPRQKGEYLTDREADEALNFIRRNASLPFFLHLNHYAVHAPIQAREDLVEKYRAKQPGEHHFIPTYAAMIESVDQALGKIMMMLDSLGLEDRTLLIFTSDNGGLLAGREGKITSNYPLRNGKGSPFEGGIRVPLIIRWPGTAPVGEKVPCPVSGIDLFPTILDYTGTAIPEDLLIDGKNLRPLFGGRKTSPEKIRSGEALFWHYPHYRGRQAPFSIILKGKWKLIRQYAPEYRYQLYDLEADPSEQTDLAASHADLVKELSGDLDLWIRQTGAKLPIPDTNLKPDH